MGKFLNDNKADAVHNHDDLYFRQSEVYAIDSDLIDEVESVDGFVGVDAVPTISNLSTYKTNSVSLVKAGAETEFGIYKDYDPGFIVQNPNNFGMDVYVTSGAITKLNEVSVA